MTSGKREPGEPLSQEEKDLVREFAYTTWEQSCQDPAVRVVEGEVNELRECRRAKGHQGPHASGFWEGLHSWD